MSTLIIIGGTGQLGSYTVRAACAEDATGWAGPIIATYNNSAPLRLKNAPERLTWTKLDCSDHKEVRRLIVSTAQLGAVAYCAVPKHGGANASPSGMVRTGIVEDVVNCAESVVMIGGRFVGISTDLVFSGDLPEGESYHEGSATSATGPYGKYKVEMEKRLLELSGDVVVARTSLILSMEGDVYGNGVRFVVDSLKGKHGETELFEDEKRNMSFADDLGLAVVELARGSHKGLLHMVADEVTDRWTLAGLLANKLGIEDLVGVHAKKGLSRESGLDRPLNCALDTTVCRKVLKTKIRGVSERLL